MVDNGVAAFFFNLGWPVGGKYSIIELRSASTLNRRFISRLSACPVHDGALASH
jgi:hypothetical protein